MLLTANPRTPRPSMPKRKDNGEVTNAILSTKLDHIARMTDQIPEIREKLAASEQERKDFSRRIDKLEARSDTWNLANSIGGLGVVAWLSIVTWLKK